MLFKIGASVKLKTGGPRMTISRIEGDQAYCVWFWRNETKGVLFPLADLVLVRA